MEVSSRVSPIATLDFVREAMVAQQQEMGKAKVSLWMARHRHYRFSGCRAENFCNRHPRDTGTTPL